MRRRVVLAAAPLVLVGLAGLAAQDGPRSTSGVRVRSAAPGRTAQGPVGVGPFSRAYSPAGPRNASLPSSYVDPTGDPPFPHVPPGIDGPGRPGGDGPGLPETGPGAPGGPGVGGPGPGFGGPFRGWWDGAPFPVEVPVYAPLYGVTPGYFPTFHPAPSTAKVVVHSGPARTTFRAKSRFPEEVTAALEDIHQDERAGGMMTSAVSAFRDRDYLAAEEGFRRVAPLDPSNGLPRFGHALAQFALGDYEGAAWSIRRGLDLLPQWVRSGQDVGAWYGEPADFEDHLQALRSRCRLREDDLEARCVLGYVLLFTGDLDGAQAAFDAVAAARPDDPLPREFLAEIAAIRGDG